ncbi:MAG: porin [Zavarzinella sp.]|nr:porin [Zavarzinella sp.]
MVEATQATDVAGPVRVFTQLAFTSLPSSGVAGSEVSGTAANIRVLHAYGQIGGWVVGKADTFFSDPFAFPNTVDAAGPNALVYLQHPLIGYVFNDLYRDGGRVLSAAASIEHPENSVTPPDPLNATKFNDRSRVPDVAAQAVFTDSSWGYLQVAGIVRDIGIENTAYTAAEGPAAGPHPTGHRDVCGWGVQCTGAVTPFVGHDWLADDLVRVGGMYGQGIANYNQDLRSIGGLDAVFDPAGRLRTLPVRSCFTSYTHFWGPGLRSTVVASQVDLDAGESLGLPGSTYRHGRYVSANLVYERDVSVKVGGATKTAQVFSGMEVLYGRKETQDRTTGSAHRVQFTLGVHYN